MLRLTFGTHRRSCAAQVEQLELALADIDEIARRGPRGGVVTTDAAPAASGSQAEAQTVAGEAAARDGRARCAVSRQTGACLACGGALRRLGEDVTEMLDYVPGAFRVIRHVRPEVILPQL